MTNKEISHSFALLAKLMELQSENPYKIRSYQRIAGTLRKLGTPLVEMSAVDINEMEGVGKAISGKIQELLQGGTMSTLERYKESVPSGIIELLQIKGLSPKKIKIAWTELGVESATDLLYACNENRLIDLKGFGERTQQEIKRQLEFFLRNRSKFLHTNVVDLADRLMRELKVRDPDLRLAWTGAFRRCDPILEKLELLMDQKADSVDVLSAIVGLEVGTISTDVVKGHYEDVPIEVVLVETSDFDRQWFVSTGPAELVGALSDHSHPSEEDCFSSLGLPYIAPEARDLARSEVGPMVPLVEISDVLGVVHTHSTFSDGVDTMADLALHSKERGYEYLVITDHSQIAVYANGLTEDDLSRQWQEIDMLNSKDQGFRIVKGIECDILNDGSLDYSPEVLACFEVVIASIHTNLRMDLKQATARIIKAIENPYTNILGHPTGRLLLGREGYPLDLDKVIDACAANQVAIELNASPYRLDLDWRWIPEAREKGVMISVNPDAHARQAIEYIDFGVKIARKGWLDKEGCLNAKAVDQFLDFCRKN